MELRIKSLLLDLCVDNTSQVETPNLSIQSTNLETPSSDSASSSRSLSITPGYQNHFDFRQLNTSPCTQKPSENSNIFELGPGIQPFISDKTFLEEFELLGTLGGGSIGSVDKMRHRVSDTLCAVKHMTLSDRTEKNIRMDLMVIRKCNYPYIVHCFGYFKENDQIHICMEVMETCLAKLMKKLSRPLPEEFIGAVAVSTLKALNYLKEEQNTIHRDVKPSNILINREGQIKLCDFSISGHLINSHARTSSAGDYHYMAPERFVGQNTRNYDVRSDVWSLGITLVELATGRLPTASLEMMHIISMVVNDEPPTLPETFSQDCRNFVEQCLKKDHNDRPKYQRLLKEPFIVKHEQTRVSVEELYKE